MPNQEQQREDKLRQLARKYAKTALAQDFDLWLALYQFAKSPEAREYHSQPVDVEKLKKEFINLFYNNKFMNLSVNDNIDDDPKIIFDWFLPHLQPQQGSEAWISVEDRLPEPESLYMSDRVLALTKERQVTILMYNHEFKRWGSEFGLIITHWQPLPAVPKTQTTSPLNGGE